MAKLEIWTFDVDPERGETCPIKTTCDARAFGYPHSDDEGRRMFVNTHFRTEGEAWKQLLAEVDAVESLNAQRYRQAQQQLKVATEDLARSAAFAAMVREARRRSP